jgi:hypothetical protein
MHEGTDMPIRQDVLNASGVSLGSVSWTEDVSYTVR